MRHGRYGWLLLTAFLGGCGPSTPSSEAPVTVSVPSQSDRSVPQSTLENAAREIVGKLRSGELAPRDVTVDFRKLIGEPLTPDERVLGYSDSAASEWLRRVGSRLINDSVRGVHSAGDLAIFELDAGTMRIVKSDGRWLLDWFHAGRSKAAAPLAGGDDLKRFTLASLLDPIATSDWALAEASLSAAAKAQWAPPLSRDNGYNRGTLRSKLASLRNGSGGYSVTWNNKTAQVTLTGSEGRTIVATIGNGPRPDVLAIHSLTLFE
jgi:hypothetical protein